MKRALVTGGSGAIGAAICAKLGADGHHVFVHAHRRIEEANAIAQRVVASGGAAEAVAFDVVDRDAVLRAIEHMQSGGHVAILVNNAGTHDDAPFAGMKLAQWQSVLDVTLAGFFNVTQPLVMPMVRARWGRIINIASVHGQVGSTGKAAYVAAKHGVIGLTKVVGLETATSQVTCNAICPGWVLTPLVQKQIDDRAAKGVDPQQAQHDLLAEKQPSLEFVTPQHLGELVLFLCSEAGSQVRGAAWNIDGGWLAQ